MHPENENEINEAIPGQPQGLTVTELAQRHLNNEHDTITDADMDNVRLVTEDQHESHLSAVVNDNDYSHKDDPDDEDDEDEEEEDMEIDEKTAESENLPKQDSSSKPVSAWDIFN